MLSAAVSVDSTTRLSAPGSCSWASVLPTRALTWSARSSRRPASMKCHPWSRTIDSAARPESASRPWSNALSTLVTASSRSADGGSSESISRWSEPMTSHVSTDSWSRSSPTASSMCRTAWATVPGRLSSTKRAKSSSPGSRWSAAWSSPTNPGYVPVMRVSESRSTATAMGPGLVPRCWNSSRRALIVRNRRTVDSARSA